MFSLMSVCLSIILSTRGGGSKLTIAYDTTEPSLSPAPHHPSAKTRDLTVQTLPVTSGDHSLRPIQTSSLEDHPQHRLSIVVCTEVCTVDKQAVPILLECFLVLSIIGIIHTIAQRVNSNQAFTFQLISHLCACSFIPTWLGVTSSCK